MASSSVTELAEVKKRMQLAVLNKPDMSYVERATLLAPSLAALIQQYESSADTGVQAFLAGNLE